ncbi:hypothetical protein [Amycolatopsis sp. NPDC059657]|uniref:hypothetical protein n=1 Tax=Amycolatopsis sp. NPDC059657 TaxID=3346899 RepID=UPI00366F56D3
MPDESTTPIHDPGPSVAVVYDADGAEHYASRTSKFVVDGLANGTLTTEPPAREEPQEGGDREAGPGGDDQKPGGRNRNRPGNGSADPAAAGGNA